MVLSVERRKAERSHEPNANLGPQSSGVCAQSRKTGQERLK